MIQQKQQFKIAMTLSALALSGLLLLTNKTTNNNLFLQETTSSRFLEFMATFSKSYSTKEEYTLRQQVFLQTLRYIEHRNSPEVQLQEGLTY